MIIYIFARQTNKQFLRVSTVFRARGASGVAGSRLLSETIFPPGSPAHVARSEQLQTVRSPWTIRYAPRSHYICHTGRLLMYIWFRITASLPWYSAGDVLMYFH